jgi:hypothetical protein
VGQKFEGIFSKVFCLILKPLVRFKHSSLELQLQWPVGFEALSVRSGMMQLVQKRVKDKITRMTMDFSRECRTHMDVVYRVKINLLLVSVCSLVCSKP